MRAFAERKGAKLGAVAQPLRAALTGRTTSPGIFEVLVVLGKAESLARLADQAKPQASEPAARAEPSRHAAVHANDYARPTAAAKPRPIFLRCTLVALRQ